MTAAPNRKQKRDVAETQAAIALESLNTAYRHWRDYLGMDGHWSLTPNVEQTRHMASVFSQFGREQDACPDRANRLILAVDRSKSLLESALSWKHASVGAKSNQTDQDRGAQWRLVMAWCGLEELINSIMEDRRRGKIEQFLESCQLEPMESFLPPHATSKLREWREKPNHGILDFLAPNKQGKDLLQRWLIKGQLLKSRTDVLVLAQTLRHSTAHGALSASKVRQWGMRDTIDRLIVELGLVAAAAIDKLVDGSGHADIAGKNRSDDGKLKALSLRQPHAEAVMRGVRLVERRTYSTTVRGRIYIYASYARADNAEEACLMQKYGIQDKSCDELPRGVILGTVELSDCTGTKSNYQWHLTNPTQLQVFKIPNNTPRSTWFTPF